MIPFKRRAEIAPLGKPQVAKRNLTIPAKKTASLAPLVKSSLAFALLIEGKGETIHLSPHAMSNPEVQRLEIALVASFSVIHREESTGHALHAITSWIAANDLHWQLARGLLTITRATLHHRKLPITESFLALLTCVDSPDGLRRDQYGDISDEQAIRKAIASAGWLRIGRVIPPASVQSELVFKRAPRED